MAEANSTPDGRRQMWNQRYAQAELVWSAEPNRFLVEETADLPPGRALDLGAGEGRNAIWLAELGWDVTAVDFSDVAMDKARTIAARRSVAVDLEVADLVEYRPQESAFDLVMLLYIHLPVEERRQVFARAAGATAPGGTILVIGHDSDNIEHGYGGPQDPSVLYSAADVTSDFAGLDVVKAGQRIREIQTDSGIKRAIDVIVRATRPAA